MPDAPWEPTRLEGLDRLEDFAGRAGRHYGEHRNSDLGPDDRTNVSTLSPYVRHRLVSEAEVAGRVLRDHSARAAERFLQEVGWRTYWKGWLEMRPEVWRDYRAEVVAGYRTLDESSALRDRFDAATSGRSGIACLDAWLAELYEVGYLHNHARMWFASLWIFTLELPWALGADLFLRHLLDGDPASNTLSWRWVAGLQTRGKTYRATAENIARFTNGRFRPRERFAEDARMPVDAPKAPAPGPIPPAPGVDVDADPRAFGLLLTEDDLSSEAFDLPRRLIRGVAGLSAESNRSPRPASGPVVDFTRQAMLDGLSRASAHFEVADGGRLETAASAEGWAGAIADWAGRLGVDRVIVPDPAVGPAGDLLAAAIPRLDRAGIRVSTVRRRWDDELWPMAKAGFFPFREKYLARVERLAEATVR